MCPLNGALAASQYCTNVASKRWISFGKTGRNFNSFTVISLAAPSDVQLVAKPLTLRPYTADPLNGHNVRLL
jgi:hypothetical protein